MNKKIVTLLLFLVYLFLGVFYLKDYGANWDEPINFMRGQTFLRYLFTGKKDYADFPDFGKCEYQLDWGFKCPLVFENKTVRRSIYEQINFSFYYEDLKTRAGHPPFGNLGAALFNQIFYVKLGWVDDIHAYNLFPVFLSAVLVAAVFYWVSSLWGSFAGLVAALSLGLYPLFLGERHFNIKDVPQTVFFALALMMFFEAVTRMSKKYLVLFIAFASMAFATKLNFGFAIFIIFPWLFYYLKTQNQPKKLFAQHKTFWIIFLITPLVMIGFLILTWPAIWFAPKLLWTSLVYHSELGTSVRSGFNPFALKYIIFTTPVIILIFSSLGIIFGILGNKSKQRQAFWLVFFWFLIPIIRVTLPKTNIYGGVRLIMEYVPAMAILAGIGAADLRGRLMRFKQTKVWSLALVLLFVPTVVKMVQLHPNESVFFNSLIGGLKGAKEHKIPDAGQSLGNPYRQGIKWINENAETGAKLAFGYEMMTNIPKVWVRPDIKFNNNYKTGPAKGGEYIISVIDYGNARFFWFRMRYLEEMMIPVFEVKVDGIPLLKVWKNDVAHTKPGFFEEKKVEKINWEKGRGYVLINLPEPVFLTRIEFSVLDQLACRELIDENGRTEISESNDPTKVVYLPASFHNFEGSVNYPQPFLLFAADKAQRIKLFYVNNNKCFNKILAVRVFALKDLKPEP